MLIELNTLDEDERIDFEIKFRKLWEEEYHWTGIDSEEAVEQLPWHYNYEYFLEVPEKYTAEMLAYLFFEKEAHLIKSEIKFSKWA